MAGVDPACFELALHFLCNASIDVPISDAQAVTNLKSLSEHIQQAVEDWFFAQEHGL